METLQHRIRLAFDLFDKGDFTKAEQIYSECLDEISKNTELYKDVIFGMGYVKAHMSKFDEARNCYKELIKMAIVMGIRLNWQCICTNLEW
ncbi:tetratricopeptide repeat protein [Sporosarcina luteola]|uniref:tetratricopeptide repeat protein n=1 Tax=Sporosarcina luteola TaxID=582850 RepID=UPI00203DB39E|nr:tetratricopeptide repeat protein [Sporosarcina luteola]MCM3711762.1 tetratricopeptide repeat protein [Sporosarcina luteola]